VYFLWRIAFRGATGIDESHQKREKMMRKMSVQLAVWRHTGWLRVAALLPNIQGSAPQLAVQGNTIKPASEHSSMGPLEYLGDILGPLWFAVPKSKVSHSKKRMKLSNKGLKNKMNIMKCQACGSAKLMHHLCECEIPKCPTTATQLVMDMSKKPDDTE
jgi:large subunit ribosomal protein L32